MAILRVETLYLWEQTGDRVSCLMLSIANSKFLSLKLYSIAPGMAGYANNFVVLGLHRSAL
jgi:hypothetical protein